VTLPAEHDRLTADVARARAFTERERARQAGAVARRHEVLAARGPEHRRSQHVEIGATHRRLQQRHLTAAALHVRHALLLERWARTDQRDPAPPAFIDSVAGSLGARSAALVLLGRGGGEALVVASDSTARAAQDLEFALREGPSRDASRGPGTLVVASGDGLSERWPRYGPGLVGLGMHAVASAPLVLAGLCLGTLTVLYPRAGSADTLGPPLSDLTDTLAHTVLLTGADSGAGLPDSPLLDGAADLRAVVHQAAGMVSVQSDCTITDALDLIRARAFADDQPIDEVAIRIVQRELRLD
jgi:hypothetical protein